MKRDEMLITAGALLLLVVIFGVPAVLVPVSMDDVPERSRTKVLIVYQDAIDTITDNFRRHNHPETVPGRLEPLPEDSMAWIKLLNPMGRRAPGGGQAILLNADDKTGAIGIQGNPKKVVVTLPAFAGLERISTVITSESVALRQ